jgi:molybdenum cofactor cytidylyltransferase
MPEITPQLIDRLIEAWAVRGRPAAVVPTYDGRRGNPVLLSAALAPEISKLWGDTGAGALLRARSDVHELPVTVASILADVDTPEALAALRG